jgi:hypothetical protein
MDRQTRDGNNPTIPGIHLQQPHRQSGLLVHHVQSRSSVPGAASYGLHNDASNLLRGDTPYDVGSWIGGVGGTPNGVVRLRIVHSLRLQLYQEEMPEHPE